MPKNIVINMNRYRNRDIEYWNDLLGY